MCHQRRTPCPHTPPNELADALPDDAKALHWLKLTDPHFVRLAEQHHTANRAVHRIEIEAEPASDEWLETVKLERLQLLDDIAAMLEIAPSS